MLLAWSIKARPIPPDFILDQRNKTDHNSLLLENPRFGLWQITFANVVSFPLEECLIEE